MVLNDKKEEVLDSLSRPQKGSIPLYFKLTFLCTNNTTNYETLILGLKIIISLNLKKIKFIGNHLLLVNQARGTYQCKYKILKKYKVFNDIFYYFFDNYEIESYPYLNNCFIDIMSNLRSLIPPNPDRISTTTTTTISIIYIPSYLKEVLFEIHCINDDLFNPCYSQLKYCLNLGILPHNIKEYDKRSFKKKETKLRFLIYILYNKIYEKLLFIILILMNEYLEA